MNRVILCSLFVLVMLSLVCSGGCGESGGRSGSSSNADGSDDPRAGWPEVITLGLVPTEGGADTQDRFGPLEEHLEAELGIRVDLKSASAYQGVIIDMENKRVDFGWFGPKSYVEAANRANAEALLLEVSQEGDPGYHSVFIVPADSEIRSLEDARGRIFAFTDPNSTSGSLIPQLVLRDELGTTAEEFFGTVRYSGAHSTSMNLVADEQVDMAAVGDLDMKKMISVGQLDPNAVRIVHTSELIPGSPYAARADLPESLKEAFTVAMLKLNDDPEMLERFQLGGFERAQDSDYDLIRAVKSLMKEQNG